MSSHHIIREKQEPALFIVDLDGFDDEQLGQLLEWSPTVMASSAVYEDLDSRGIKIDMVVGEIPAEAAQLSSTFVPVTGTVLGSGLSALLHAGYPAVNVIDPTVVPDRYSAFVGRIGIVILTPHRRIFPVSPGFSKWKPAGERLTIFGDPAGLVTSGLKRYENNYVTTTDGFYTLTFAEPFIFVGETYRS